MPIFRYRGYSRSGSEAAGTIEADGISDALRKIKEQGYFPKTIEESLPARRFKGRGGELAPMMRQLSVLIKSGVPLVEALRAVAEENRRMNAVLVAIRERVQSGASLSRAMEEFGDMFPEFFRSMVASGEASGTLDKVLERLADFLEGQASLREKVTTAMIYPFFMAAVGFVVLAFLFTFVIPKIVRIFEDVKGALPFATVVLIWVSNVFVHYWWLLAIALIAVLASARPLRKRHQRSIDRLTLRLPLQSLYLTRFARSLGFLLGGGLPMLKALELAGKSTGNVYLEDNVREAALKVSDGASLSASLAGLPPVLIALISTGEKSGRLVEVLDMAADAYEEDFDRVVRRALALIEPGMILFMGLIVGFVVLAVLLPMFQLNQLIK